MVKNKLKAFTLLEVVIIIGAFLGLTLIFMPIGIEQLQSSKIDNVVKDIKSIIYNQAQSAFSFKNNKGYGIAFYSDHYIIFSGDSLAQADSQTRVNLSGEIELKNINLNDLGNELRFSKGSFRPHTYGSIQVTASRSAYLITINTEGLILVTKQ